MIDAYIRRGILRGNTDLPVDSVPSLVGNGIFTLVGGVYHINGMITDQQPTAKMIVSCNPFGNKRSDTFTFNSSSLESILTAFRQITVFNDDNISVNVYEVMFQNGALIISAPSSTSLYIEGVSEPNTGNAADYLGFYQIPDPRAVSLINEPASSPGREYAPSNNRVSYIAKFEDRTSQSINRAVDSVALNVEDLYLNTRVHRKATDLCTIVPSLLPESVDTIKHYAVCARIESIFVVPCIDLHMYPIQVSTPASQTFSEAMSLPIVPSAVKASIVDEDIQSTEVVNTNLQASLKTKSANTEEVFGSRPQFHPYISLHKVSSGFDVALSETQTISCDGETITGGFVPYAGYFKLPLKTIGFTVIDQVTIQLSNELSDDLLAVCRAEALISLKGNTTDLDYGYKITHVIGKDKLIVEPVKDIEHRVAPVDIKNIQHILPVSEVGQAKIFIGDRVPDGFFAAVRLAATTQSIELSDSAYLQVSVSEGTVSTFPPSYGSNLDEIVFTRQLNSSNSAAVADSISASLSGNVSNRSTQSKLFKLPYIERLIETNTDFGYGNNTVSSLIKTITANPETVLQINNTVLAYGISGANLYSAISTGIVPQAIRSDIQEIAESLFVLNTELGVAGTTYTYADGTSVVVDDNLIQSLDYSTTRNNPFVLLILLILADVTPFLASANNLVCEQDGYLRKSNTFSTYDLGRDFAVYNQFGYVLCRMTEFVSPNVARFVKHSDGKALSQGSYTSIVGCKGSPMYQAFEVAYNGVDSISIDSESVQLRRIASISQSSFMFRDAGGDLVLDVREELSTDNKALIYQLPTIAQFTPQGGDLTPLQGIFYVAGEALRARYGNSRKLVVYLEHVVSGKSISGFYDVISVRPAYDSYEEMFFVDIVLGNPLGSTVHTLATLDALNNILDSTSVEFSPNNIYTYDSDALQDSAILVKNITIYEVMSDDSHSSLRSDTLTIRGLNAKLESGDASGISPVVVLNSDSRKTSISVSIADQILGETARPFLAIDDGEKTGLSRPSFTSSNVIGTREYSTSPTIVISKDPSERDTGLQISSVGIGSNKADIALLSIEDYARSSENRDSYGRETDKATSIVGNTSLSGLVRIESDVRDSKEAITNYKGTGYGRLGGVDSNLNPTTSAHSNNDQAIHTNTLTHAVYDDGKIPAQAQYPKYLGEEHVLFFADMQENAQVSIIDTGYDSNEDSYYSLSVQIVDTSLTNADNNRAVLVKITDIADPFIGYVYEAYTGGFKCRVNIGGAIVAADIESIAVLGREWNANIGTLAISNRINILYKGTNTVAGGIYAQNGKVVVDNLDVATTDVENTLFTCISTNDILWRFPQGTAFVAQDSFYQRTKGFGYRGRTSGTYFETDFVRLYPKAEYSEFSNVGSPVSVLRSKMYIPDLGSYGKLVSARHGLLTNEDENDDGFSLPNWSEYDGIGDSDIELVTAEYELINESEEDYTTTTTSDNFPKKLGSGNNFAYGLVSETTNNRYLEMSYDCISRIYKSGGSSYVYANLQGKVIPIFLSSTHTDTEDSTYKYIAFTCTVRLNTKFVTNAQNIEGVFSSLAKLVSTEECDISISRPTFGNLSKLMRRAMLACNYTSNISTAGLLSTADTSIYCKKRVGTGEWFPKRLRAVDKTLKNALQLGRDASPVLGFYYNHQYSLLNRTDWVYSVQHNGFSPQTGREFDLYKYGPPNTMFSSPYDDPQGLTEIDVYGRSIVGETAEYIPTKELFFMTADVDIVSEALMFQMNQVAGSYNGLDQSTYTSAQSSIFGDKVDIDCIMQSSDTFIRPFLEEVGCAYSNPYVSNRNMTGAADLDESPSRELTVYIKNKKLG